MQYGFTRAMPMAMRHGLLVLSVLRAGAPLRPLSSDVSSESRLT